MAYPTRIIDLTEQLTVAAADQVPVYSQSQGTRRVSVTNLAATIEGLISLPLALESVYSAPSATGFTVTIAPSVAGGSVWLILTPTAGFAAGTIALPASGDAVDGQEVLVNCTQAVTTLTVSASGLTVTGAPTALTANQAFRMKFDAVTSTWYKVG